MIPQDDFELNKVYKETLNREFTSSEKAWYEENSTNESSVKLSNIWVDDIPKTPPETNTDIVEIIDWELTEDLTVSNHKTWFMCREKGLLTSREGDFIQPSRGQSIKYHIKIRDANDRQVYIGEELEWSFDYEMGILTFKEDPSAKYAIPFKAKAFKYIGKKGSIKNLSIGGAGGAYSLDEAYDGYDGSGDGREINADSGPVKITAADGHAPFQLTPLDYVPIKNLEDGQIMIKDGITYVFDDSRNSWVSMVRQAIAFGAKRADGVMMNLSNFSSNMSGWPALRDGTIMGITAQASGGYSKKHIDIRIKGVTDVLFGFNLNNHYYADGNLNLPFSANDLIQIKVSSQYEMTYNLVLNLEIAWRCQ